MSIHSKDENKNPTQFSRRSFLARSLAAASASPLLIDGWSRTASAALDPAKAPQINAGFVAPQYYDKHEEESLIDVLEEGSPFRFYGQGKAVKVKEFEEGFANYMGAPYALAVTSGTTALNSAITGLGIGPGDEVIVPAYTWWSDYTCVVHAGALPVFADIDESMCLDPQSFEKAITPRTKAVIAVHLLGGPCDMDPIMDIAKKKGIAVLEDCAQCVGGSYHGKKLGTIGDVGIYSFQLHKMISSGEGGAVVTGNPLIYERACRFHNMGGFDELFKNRIGKTQLSNFAGENYRMNEFTGAVLWAQLPKLDTMIRDMRRNAEAVRDGIKDLPGIKKRKRPDPQGDIGYAVYIETKSKEQCDQFLAELRKRKVPCSRLTGSVLLPVAESVMQKQTRHPNWPSFTSPEGKAIEYGPDTCRQTLDIYDRFVQIRIGPKYTDEMNDWIIAGVREVYSQLT
ncbi:MAG: DegT/DnrJ/EryC1/StrS family aminotransferase [Candidatus Omnitrophota bacterium]|jgi:8-amino-3,8-dideoxy-alpha-D-manno-octulosonate transaminase|nr:MAG: DegT/DnrJ/EryC1/StrS family aminotransferase [Candidatus Omnitrophota bacterium]